MRVSEQFISSLLARIDLVDLINKKINLRRVGANFIGLCPFHEEKTPSFTVNQAKQFFHCFGCQKSGDAIQFIMETEHKSFVDAVTNLADSYGLCLEKEPEVDPIIAEIYNVLDLAENYFHKELFNNNPVSIKAINYLEQRSINLETIKHFKLGVANAGWTNLVDFFSKQKQFIDLKLLLQSGLAVEKNDKLYDRFRLRIIFPIKNKFGKTIGFGARALTQEQTPKYLNSPETIVFKKNQELYGLNEVKARLKSINSLIIVEGYLDVLTLMQSGISNVVATLGTALNETHVKIAFGVAPEINFCFDGDSAGYKAMIKAMELCMNMLALGEITAKQIVKFVLLPNSYDPDLLVKEQGSAQFINCVANAKSLSQFFFEYLAKKYPDKTVENLNQLAQEAKLYLNKFKDYLLRNLWEQKLKELLGIDLALSNFNNKDNNKKFSNLNRFNSKNNYPVYPVTNATKALAMLLIKPELLKFCDLLDYSKFTNIKLLPDVDLFIKVVILINNNIKNVNIEYLVLNLEQVYIQKLRLIEAEKIVQLIPEAGIEQEFIGAVKKINTEVKKQLVDELLIISKNRNLESQEKLLLQQILKEL